MPELRTRLLAQALFALSVLAGCASGGDVAMPQDDDGLHGVRLDQPYAVPQEPLTDTDGEPFSLAGDTDAPLTLVFFGYTRCPDVCRIVMSSLASAVAQLDDEEQEQVEVVFVTTDPGHDDAATVRAWLDRYDPDFTGLTGDLDEIAEAGRALAIAVEEGERTPDGGYEVGHGTQVVAVTADDTAPVVWTEGTSAGEFADDVAVLLDEGTG